jgi:hypothetical protein
MCGFVSRRLDIMRTVFIAYIRPILEYNSLVWNPCHVHSIDVLENMQHNFSKPIPSLSSLTYLERLALLNLEPLELRRLRFDLTNTKFNTTSRCLILTLFFISIRPLKPLDPILLTCKSPTMQPLLSSFFCRCLDARNYLPSNLRHAQSTSAFKRAIKCVDLSRFFNSSFVK